MDAGNRVRLTPLMRSAMEGNADTCELLLAAGAKVGQEVSLLYTVPSMHSSIFSFSFFYNVIPFKFHFLNADNVSNDI